MTKHTKVLVNAVALSALISCTAALAQGVGNPPMSPPHAQGAKAGNDGKAKDAAVRQRVVEWFTKYDAIRHEAQMTPAEKSSANKFMAGAFTGNAQDKTAGRALLSKMVSRYTKAVAQLKTLKTTPETAKLQQAYQQYFTTGGQFFKRYLKALNENKPFEMASNLDQGRKQLGFLDLSNKALDKKLRKQYRIMPYPW